MQIELSCSCSCSCNCSVVADVYLSVHLYICLSICLSVCLSLDLSVCLPSNLSVYLSICLSASLKTKLSCGTFSIFEFDNIENTAVLRDFLNFRSWQHQKRSNSARLPSKMENWVQSWRPRANAFCDFSTPSVQSIASKVVPGHTKSCTCHANWSQTWRSDAPKCNPSQEISALTS